MVQLYQAFDREDRCPDLYLSAAPYSSIGDVVDGEGSASKHGGLTKEEAWATAAVRGTGIAPWRVTTARNVDVVPTMLFLLRQPFDPRRLDGRVIPEVCAMMRDRRVVDEEEGESPCDATLD